MVKVYGLPFMKASIRTMTLEEFRGVFAVNERRSYLLGELLEELNVVARQCEKVSVIVFGSYITGKEEPGDIDVLVSLVPKKDHVYSIMKNGLEKEHVKNVDVQFQRGEYFTKSAGQLVDYFNGNPYNFRKGIRIDRAVELLVPGLCGD